MLSGTLMVRIRNSDGLCQCENSECIVSVTRTAWRKQNIIDFIKVIGEASWLVCPRAQIWSDCVLYFVSFGHICVPHPQQVC